MKTYWNKPQKKRKKRSFDTSKSLVSEKLDLLWSSAIKIRDKQKCQVCGSMQSLNSHHIITRKNKSVRFDLDNGITLCAKHHKLDSRQSAHGNPLWFTNWLEAYKKGLGDRLIEKSQKPFVLTIDDLKAMHRELTEFIELSK